MSNNNTNKFINNLNKLNEREFSSKTLNVSKRCLLDYIGVTIAGARIQKNKTNNFVNYLYNGKGEISVIGLNKKLYLTDAAFINGLNSHVAELDDGTRFGGIHPGAPIISALLPLAKRENISGEKFLKSIIIGYEAAIRVAQSIQPSHSKKGYHATGTCGTIGAVIGISILLDFSVQKMKNALSAAANIASGTLKIIEDNSDLKPLNVANASKSAILSAFMARADFSGPDDILSNKGFLELMSDDFDLSFLDINEKDIPCIEKVYFKPYAACRHSHASIEASLNLKLKHNISIRNIKEINVYTYNYIIGKHDHKNIKNISSAKMSIPYSVAVSLIKEKSFIDEYTDEAISDNMVLSLANKVNVFEDYNINDLVPNKRPAIVEIKTKNGENYKERVDFPKGEPENPLTKEEIESKFISLATYGNKTYSEAEKIIECVWDIENKIDELFQLL